MKRLALLLPLLAACATAAPPTPTAKEAPRPQAITTSNVPPVPSSLMERLRRYQDIRPTTFLDWSPDGKEMLVAKRAGSTTQIHIVREPGGPLEQITRFDEPVSGGRFLKDGSVLFAMGRGGDENFQIWRLDRATGQTKMFTDGTSRHVLMAMDKARARVVVGITMPKARDTDLYILDCMTGKTEPLHEAKGQDWGARDWSPDGSKLVLERTVSANESYLHVCDVATKNLTPIPIPGGGKASHGATRFSVDGRSIYVASDATGEFRTRARVDLATLQYTWLGGPPWDVDDLEIATNGWLATVTNEDGLSRLTLSDLQAVELPVGVIGGMRFSPDGTRLAFTLNRADAPGDAYVLDGRKLVRWTFTELGDLEAQVLVVPQLVTCPSFDGTRVPFYVYRPRAAKKASVIIDLHGGPEGQARPFFSPMTQFYVNELGCAVLYPNVRGSSGYGKSYLAADNAEKREDSVRDIGAILDWIAKQPDLDASRVAVLGGSYGGYMVLASLVHFGDRLRAGVDIVGIANFRTFLESTSAYRRDLRRVEYGDERDPKMQAVFERISPANNAVRIRSALLVAHGRNDPRVPFGEAEQIAAKARGPVWTVFAANEGHGFARRENRDYLNAVIVAFFQAFLLK